MLTELANKIKTFWKENRRDLYLAALVFLTSTASFGLGRLSAIWPAKEPIMIENQKSRIMNQGSDGSDQPAQILDSRSQIPDSSRGNYVASRNGSSYHLPDCPGAKQIKEENKIWFPSAEAARAAGYKPAGNCPGL